MDGNLFYKKTLESRPANQNEMAVSGSSLPDFNETRQAGQILIDRMKQHGDRIAFTDASTGGKETFSSFRLRCLRAAQVLRTQYCAGPAHTICICSGNTSDAFCTAVAAILCGAPYCVIHTEFGKDDMTYILSVIRPRLVFCNHTSAALIERAFKETFPNDDVTIVLYDKCTPEKIHKYFCEFQRETGNEEEFQAQEFSDMKKAIALILCSSGTSGLPKVIQLSHYAFIRSYFTKTERYAIKNQLTFATLYWNSGSFALFFCLYEGVTLFYIDEKFSEKLCSELVQNFKIVHILLPPSSMNSLMKYSYFAQYDWSSLKSILLTGAIADLKYLAKFGNENLPCCKILIAYGASEVGLISMKDIKEHPVESVGRIESGVSVKIIDRDTKKSLRRNQVGEICIKTDRTMMGYRNNPQATADALDCQGWFHSGDAGYLDENGFLYINDRYKEMLKYQSWQISPAEIEIVLRRHSAVAECCVTGVPYGPHGDLIIAFVMTTPLAQVSEQELKDFVAARLSDAKRLRGGVKFLTQIPTLPAGKVDRQAIKKRALDMADELERNADI